MQVLQLADSFVSTGSPGEDAGPTAGQQRGSQPVPDPAKSGSSGGSTDGSISRHPVAAAASPDNDPFAAPTQLHGPQRKMGPLDPREWLQPYALERHAVYMDYLEQWEKAHGANPPPSGGLPPPQPATFPTCQVWVVSWRSLRVLLILLHLRWVRWPLPVGLSAEHTGSHESAEGIHVCTVHLTAPPAPRITSTRLRSCGMPRPAPPGERARLRWQGRGAACLAAGVPGRGPVLSLAAKVPGL